MFDTHKTRMIRLPCGEETDNVLSRFHRIRERKGQTDGHNCCISIARKDADAR